MNSPRPGRNLLLQLCCTRMPLLAAALAMLLAGSTLVDDTLAGDAATKPVEPTISSTKQVTSEAQPPIEKLAAEKSAPAASEETEAVRQAREALTRGRSYPWYDSSNDSLRRIQLRVQEKREKNAAPNLPGAADALQIVAWGIIAVVLAALIGLLIYGYLQRENSTAEAPRPDRDVLSDVDRVEALPFMAQRSPTDLLGQARAYYEAGNYREAIIYLFSHELVELDKQGLIHLAKGKTNRQYLREVAAIDELRRILHNTMVAFEDVFFGNHELTRSQFEVCWQELAAFERRLVEAVA